MGGGGHGTPTYGDPTWKRKEKEKKGKTEGKGDKGGRVGRVFIPEAQSTVVPRADTVRDSKNRRKGTLTGKQGVRRRPEA